jgi:hypothetical protein
MEIVSLIDAIDGDSNRTQNKEKPNDVSKDKNSKKKKMKKKVAMTVHEASPNGKYVQPGHSTSNQDDETEAHSTDYYWDENLQAYVYTGVKRPRKKDMANKMKNKWLMGMNRNCAPAKRKKMIAKMTVTRANMNMVSTHIPYKFPLA